MYRIFMNPQWIQFSSATQSCPTLCEPMDCNTPALHYLLESAHSHVHWVDRYLILCRPLLLRPSIFPSIRVFSNESALCIRWPKYWSFSFNISPFNEHLRLIFFRMDWLDLLAVQGTPRVLSNTTVQKHQIFCTQLSL